MGQYAHGNQPIQHMIYLYNYAGPAVENAVLGPRSDEPPVQSQHPMAIAATKTTAKPRPGMYFRHWVFIRLRPATDQYVLGAPLFKKATLKLDNGNTFTINAPDNSDSARYVKSALLNGKPYTKNWISQTDIQKGGAFTFMMSETPDKSRGTEPKDYPYSFSNQK